MVVTNDGDSSTERNNEQASSTHGTAGEEFLLLGIREEWSLVRLSEFSAHVDPKLFNAFWLWSEEPSPCNLHVFLE